MSRKSITDDVFGARLRLIRKRSGLTQKEFCVQLGIGVATIQRLEQSEHWPHEELLVKLMTKFGCDPGWLLTGRGLPAGKECVPVFKDFETYGDDSAVIGQVCLPGVPSSGFAVQIMGDDMMPTVRNGDYVIFQDVEQAEGDVVLFGNQWKELRVRRVSFMNGAELIADHPEMPPIKVGGNVAILGKVSQVLRHIKF